ncbi:cell division protein FtsX [Oharaeibacter diazotrophicus]|uniref:Cell division transport system permease protein n=1 Tax=Oharaeibacter diazotrophicus TaxID=1920512 RepID=A0A4R6RD68_9HYPH|nr:ABC transporter permease [Oharaeibacter diazotrophicus]TDP84089.1 cell division transport system permease protein [Oharaeibacter diazotrophicus]BBE73128.1 cell division ABC transporter subunit FtsX [Pleomorphomonas sp. SM30]GLS74917.1 cell division protein FtsX [Oharaeibacter diazotrophicus]
MSRADAPHPAGDDGEGRRRTTPIVPPQSIAGRTLALVVAIMTFLAGLTIGAVTMVDAAARAWQSDIGREVTIEVRPLDGVAIAGELDKAAALAQEFPGVGGARALTDAETRRLLEPWLGAGVDLAALPVPRLVVVTIDDPGAFDVAALAASVKREIRGGAVDDHAAWIDRLRAMAQSMVLAGLAVLALVLVALTLSVVFATRAAMAGNRHIIEVLHFCGAEDRFVAGQFQRHFLVLGVRGGAIGGGLAALVFAAASWWFRGSAGLPGADQIEGLAGAVEIGWQAYAGVAVLVVAVAGLTAATSRLAVRRSLAAIE